MLPLAWLQVIACVNPSTDAHFVTIRFLLPSQFHFIFSSSAPRTLKNTSANVLLAQITLAPFVENSPSPQPVTCDTKCILKLNQTFPNRAKNVQQPPKPKTAPERTACGHEVCLRLLWAVFHPQKRSGKPLQTSPIQPRSCLLRTPKMLVKFRTKSTKKHEYAPRTGGIFVPDLKPAGVHVYTIFVYTLKKTSGKDLHMCSKEAHSSLTWHSGLTPS